MGPGLCSAINGLWLSSLAWVELSGPTVGNSQIFQNRVSGVGFLGVRAMVWAGRADSVLLPGCEQPRHQSQLSLFEALDQADQHPAKFSGHSTQPHSWGLRLRLCRWELSLPRLKGCLLKPLPTSSWLDSQWSSLTDSHDLVERHSSWGSLCWGAGCHPRLSLPTGGAGGSGKTSWRGAELLWGSVVRVWLPLLPSVAVCLVSLVVGSGVLQSHHPVPGFSQWCLAHWSC